MEILLITFAVLVLLLAFRLFAFEKGIRNIRDIIGDVRNGNRNRRLHIKSNSLIAGLSSELNSLLEDFSAAEERRIYLEQLRIKMFSDISHDIRTPLTSLLGYAEALLKDPALSDEEKSRYTEIIALKGNVLYSLMDEYFELSKLDEDHSDHLLKVDISEKIRQVLVTFYHEFTRLQIEPEIKLPDEAVYVLGDDKYIERVLQNLVSNSLRYGSDGGSFGIRLSREDDRVLVEIWDNGKGITEQEQNLIFERLYTSDASRNRVIRGSGLGLAIVKKLLEKMNGGISVESRPNIKTSFCFYLKPYPEE